MENEQEIKFYSVAEVSEILGISRSKAYEWVAVFLLFLVRRWRKMKCEIRICKFNWRYENDRIYRKLYNNHIDIFYYISNIFEEKRKEIYY